MSKSKKESQTKLSGKKPGNGKDHSATPLDGSVPVTPEVQLEIKQMFREASQAHAAGKVDFAQTLYMEILKRKVDHAEALNNLGDLARTSGNEKVAKELFRKATVIKPKYAVALKNLYSVCLENGETAEAMIYIDRYLKVDPKDEGTICKKGDVLLAMGKSKESFDYFDKLTRDNPNKSIFHLAKAINLGNATLWDESIEPALKSVELSPKNAGSHMQLATAYYYTKQLEKAAAGLEKTLELQPNLLPALATLYMVCQGLDRMEDADKYLKQALSVKNPENQIFGNTNGQQILCGLQFKSALQISEIMDSEEEITEVREKLSQNIDELERKNLYINYVEREVGVTNFFLSYHGLDNRQFQERIANLYMNASPQLMWTAPHCEKLSKEKSITKPKRLKIAFISSFLREHTIGKLMFRIIELLPRDRFEVIIIRPVGYRDAYIQALDQCVDASYEIPTSIREMHRIIACLELDIIFYPDIGMLPATYYLAFSRLAPVQAVTWGHPETSGIPNVDYFISSKFIEPDNAQKFYTEQLIELDSMPTCYIKPQTTEPYANRAKYGFTDDENIYCCPQSLFKFHPQFDYILSEILNQDPKAKLVLVSGNKIMFEKLRKRLAQSFPEHADRIVNTGQVSRADYMCLAASSDVILDPIIFSGGNSSLEMFSVNCPIVTMPGDFMRARVTYGYYQQMGVYDLVAKDPDDYIRLALKLANDKEFNTAMREKIKEKSPIMFDNQETISEMADFFEAAYAAAMEGKKVTQWPPE